MPEYRLALHDHQARPEPDSLIWPGRAAAQHGELTAVERRVRPQPEAERAVPVQLAAAVLGQAGQPGAVGAVPQGALHHAAAPADYHPAQHQRQESRGRYRDSSQASCDS